MPYSDLANPPPKILGSCAPGDTGSVDDTSTQMRTQILVNTGMDKEVDKSEDIQAMEYHATIKMDKLQTHATTWMNLTNIYSGA